MRGNNTTQHGKRSSRLNFHVGPDENDGKQKTHLMPNQTRQLLSKAAVS